MFKRKLIALDFYSPNSFDYQDEKTFRNFVSWLENQKIRFYTIEDRVGLDNVDSENWPKFLDKYLNDLELNGLNSQTTREELIEKLLSHAIRLEYSDNIEKINTLNANQDEFVRQNSETNSLENINYNSAEFVEGLHRMQRLLNVPSKQDDVTTVLQALSKLIVDKLNPNVIQTFLNQKNNSTNAQKDDNSVQLSLESINTGLDSNDQVLNDSVRVLRLLHIKELRDLQTKINETIVNVQGITANPKTDSSLGKVGI